MKHQVATLISVALALVLLAATDGQIAHAESSALTITPERLRIRNDGTNGVFIVHNRSAKRFRLVRFRPSADMTVRVEHYRAGASGSFLKRSAETAGQFARLSEQGFVLSPGGMMFVSVLAGRSSPLGWRAVGIEHRLEPRGPVVYTRLPVHVRAHRPPPRPSPSPRCRAVAQALPLACLSHEIYGDSPKPAACRRFASRKLGTWESLYQSVLSRRYRGNRRKIRRQMRKARRSGFNAGIYSSVGRVLLVFEGTQVSQIGDLLTDLGNILGIQTRQYKIARLIAAEAKRLYPRIVLTGHSLGGGLADWAATGSLLDAVAFNPAYPRGIVSPAERELRWGRDHVRAFVIDGELASVAHPGRSSGQTQTFNGDHCTTDKHSMECVVDTLQRFHNRCARP